MVTGLSHLFYRVGFRRPKVNRSTTSTFNALANFSSPATDGAFTPRSHEADELRGQADSFGQFRLRQSPRLSESCNPPPEFLLKHGFGYQMPGLMATQLNYGSPGEVGSGAADHRPIHTSWFCGASRKQPTVGPRGGGAASHLLSK